MLARIFALLVVERHRAAYRERKGVRLLLSLVRVVNRSAGNAGGRKDVGNDERVSAVVSWAHAVVGGLGGFFVKSLGGVRGRRLRRGARALKPIIMLWYSLASLDLESLVGTNRGRVPAWYISGCAASHGQGDGAGLGGAFLELRWL